MIVWPARVWEPQHDSEGKLNGLWTSRPVTNEDRIRREEFELELQQASAVGEEDDEKLDRN